MVVPFVSVSLSSPSLSLGSLLGSPCFIESHSHTLIDLTPCLFVFSLLSPLAPSLPLSVCLSLLFSVSVVVSGYIGLCVSLYFSLLFVAVVPCATKLCGRMPRTRLRHEMYVVLIRFGFVRHHRKHLPSPLLPPFFLSFGLLPLCFPSSLILYCVSLCLLSPIVLPLSSFLPPPLYFNSSLPSSRVRALH